MNSTNTSSISTKKPLTFFALIFLFSFPIWILAALTTQFIPEWMPINHIGFIAIVVPITVAFILTTTVEGRDRATKLLKRSFDYKRISRKIWYLPILLLLPAIFILSFGFMILMGVQLPEDPVPVVVVPFLFLLFILFAYCEEVGWQGYIFGPMEEKWNALRASIVLGTIGGIWHLPLYIIQNPPGGAIWITGQFLNAVLIRILTVWIFNNTRKSIFATVLFHAVYNLCTIVLFPIHGSPLGPMIVNIFLITTIILVIYFWGSDTLSHFRFRKRDWKHSPSHSYTL